MMNQVQINPELLAELESKAKAATPGEWGRDNALVCPARREGGTTYVESWHPVAEANTIADARFIASANPAIVLALLEHISSLSKRLEKAAVWMPVKDRMPEKGVMVMVYSPPQPGDWPDSVRITIDWLDPECDDDYWYEHGESYEHYCCVAKCGDTPMTAPAATAPYTYWMPLPAAPATSQEGADHE